MTANAYPALLYNSVFTVSPPVATDTDADTQYNILNIIDYRQGTFWKAASIGTKYITGNAGAAVDVDSLFILSHNLGTASATISVESSATGVWAGDTVERLAGFVPTNDLAIFKAFTSASDQFWRIKIVTAAIVPFLAITFLGERLTFERWIMGSYKPKPQSAKGETSENVDGLFINSVVASHRLKFNLRFANLTPTWVTANLLPAIEAHLKFGLPFVWVWDKDNHPTDIFYVRVPLGTELAAQFNKSRQSFTLRMIGVSE